MYLGMVISSISRQCVLKLKEYSVKKNTAARRNHSRSAAGPDGYRDEENPGNNPGTLVPLVAITNEDNTTSVVNDTLDEPPVDHSFLGRFLNCKPCRQVTEGHEHRKVLKK